MDLKDFSGTILKELTYSLTSIPLGEANALVSAILKAGRIYVAGAGRSLLMMRCFAMRMMHLELSAYVVGETVTPAIGPGDLLLIGSGSGETGTLTVLANRARSAGASLALITAHADSTIAKLSDVVVTVPVPTTKKASAVAFETLQPGASLFEQTLLLLGDAIVLEIQRLRGVPDKNESMNRLHANLE